jgi:hypothetical protein
VIRSRTVIANQTYPVANITSIRTDIDFPPTRTVGPIVGVIFGTILVLAGLYGSLTVFVIGAALIVLAAYRWRQSKPTYTIFYTIFLGTAGGDKSALRSENGEFVFRVADAIDEALIAGSR